MGFWQFATGGGSGGGTGDVVGPASSTDNAVARWDLATGKLLQNSAMIVADTTGDISWNGDTGLARSAAGVVKVTDGGAGGGALLGIASVGQFALDDGGGIGALIASFNYYALKLAGNRPLVWGPVATFSGTTSARYSGDVGLIRNDAVGVLRVTDGSTGIGKLLNAVLVEANTAGSGAPNAIAATESGTAFTNEGVTAKNYEALPTAAAGYQYTFIVQDADGMRIVANTGDTIRVIDKVTAAAGYIESTTIGSVVTLIAINATEWIATSIHGTWTDGTFTYDDTSLTTP